MKSICLILIIFLVISVQAQEIPNASDSNAYAEAYKLIFDSEGRARKAEKLLLDDGRKLIRDLSVRELILLIRIYAELFDSEKQLEAARALWERDPNSATVTAWMDNALLNNLGKSTTADSIIQFADDNLSKGRGHRRGLLILKARALVSKNGNVSDAEKKLQITDLLLEASKERVPDSVLHDFPEFSPGSLLNLNIDWRFSTFFTAPERNELMLKMKQNNRDRSIK